MLTCLYAHATRPGRDEELLEVLMAVAESPWTQSNLPRRISIYGPDGRIYRVICALDRELEGITAALRGLGFRFDVY